MKVWLAQRQCLDFYCGCGGGHVVGVFETSEQAREALKTLGLDDFDSLVEIPVGEARWVDSPGADVGYRGEFDPRHAWT